MSATQRRSQLITVAKDVFAEYGYEATTIEEIASRAGVSKPMVYQHFKGKEGIYAVVVDREVNALLDRITQGLTIDGRGRDLIHSSAMAFLDYLDEDPAGFKVLVRDAPATINQGEVGGLLDEVSEKAAMVLTTFMERAGRNTDVAPLYAKALVGCIVQVGTWWDNDRSMSKEEVADHLTALVFFGLSNLPADPNAALAKSENGRELRRKRTQKQTRN